MTFYISQGAHLKLHARSDNDLDEDEIMDKVSKSSGCNYSYHKETPQPIEEPKPVVCTFKTNLIMTDISTNNINNLSMKYIKIY